LGRRLRACRDAEVWKDRCGVAFGRVVDAAFVKRHLAGRQTLIVGWTVPLEVNWASGGAERRLARSSAHPQVKLELREKDALAGAANGRFPQLSD
jgi:hypothetical protein